VWRVLIGDEAGEINRVVLIGRERRLLVVEMGSLKPSIKMKFAGWQRLEWARELADPVGVGSRIGRWAPGALMATIRAEEPSRGDDVLS